MKAGCLRQPTVLAACARSPFPTNDADGCVYLPGLGSSAGLDQPGACLDGFLHASGGSQDGDDMSWRGSRTGASREGADMREDEGQLSPKAALKQIPPQPDGSVQTDEGVPGTPERAEQRSGQASALAGMQRCSSDGSWSEVADEQTILKQQRSPVQSRGRGRRKTQPLSAGMALALILAAILAAGGLYLWSGQRDPLLFSVLSL